MSQNVTGWALDTVAAGPWNVEFDSSQLYCPLASNHGNYAIECCNYSIALLFLEKSSMYLNIFGNLKNIALLQ